MWLVALGCALTALLPELALAASPGGQWERWQTVPGVVDVAGPTSDGRLVVAAGPKLLLLDPGTGQSAPFADGAGGYPRPPAGEPYIAVSPGQQVPGAGCSFAPDDVYALELKPPGGIVRVTAAGAGSEFARVDGVESLGGIAFDTTGAFGHRLLVTGTSHGTASVVAIDCRGQVTRIADGAPLVEGGIAVAPVGFGPFAGDLIAPDELSGRIYAFRPDGSNALVADSGLPTGGDIGVEGAGFVPPGFAEGGAAYYADRLTPGNPHPGSDHLLRLPAAALTAAGVGEGDLLVSTEGGAATLAVHCAGTCSIRHLGAGDGVAHGEGHLLVIATHRPASAPATMGVAADLGRSTQLRPWLLASALAVLALIALLVPFMLRRWRSRHQRGADPP